MPELVLIEKTSKLIYINEINTLPGSLYHHNWRKAGVSATELVTELINLAEDRFRAQQNIIYAFNSDVLH